MKKIYLVTENISWYNNNYAKITNKRNMFMTDNYDLAKNSVDRANKVLEDKGFIDWMDKMSYEELEALGVEYLEWYDAYDMLDTDIEYSITEIELDNKPKYSRMLELMLKDYEKYENKETGE